MTTLMSERKRPKVCPALQESKVLRYSLPSAPCQENLSLLKTLFRQYDVRGVVSGHSLDLTQFTWPKEVSLSAPLAYAIGCAYAAELRETYNKNEELSVAVAYDARLTGPELTDALEQGLRCLGINVIHLGLVPTPVVYFATYALAPDLLDEDGSPPECICHGGIMVTGSHNPSAWNGFKLSFGRESVYGAQLQRLYHRIAHANYTIKGIDSTAHRTNKWTLDLSDKYLDELHRRVQFSARPLSDLKVVIDAGHGASGPLAIRFFEGLGVQLKTLYCTPDGHFPAHHPDPTVEENLTDLKEEVLAWGADVGLGFDGDGDRLGVVDGEGAVLWGDQLLLLFAQAILAHTPGEKIIGEVKCSQVLYDGVKEAGGVAEMWQVGHSLIKARMKACSAPLAGEMSGHLFFADRFYGFDDAIYAGARLLERLTELDFNLSTWRENLPEMINTPELRVYCADQDKLSVINRFSAAFAKDYEVNTIDGARVMFDQGWGLVRASNTQPVLVMRFEASSHELLDRYRSKVEEWLKEHTPEVRFDIDPNH